MNNLMRAAAPLMMMGVALSSTAVWAQELVPPRTSQGSPAGASASEGISTYRIKAGDQIQIYVWGEERLQREMRVLPDGTIAFPLVGQVAVRGRLPQEVEALIRGGLSSQYRGEVPQVTVSVVAPAPTQFTVVGRVSSAGTFETNRPINVLEALSLAGGATEFANLDKIVVLRKTTDGGLMPIEANVKSLMRGDVDPSVSPKRQPRPDRGGRHDHRPMTKRGHRSLAASVSAVAIVASIVSAAPAVAQVRATVDASARATAASHPVGTSGEGGAVAIGVQIDPSIYYEGNEATTALLRGTASIDQYTGDLGTASSFSVNATAQHRLNSRTTVGVTASAMSSRSAVRDFLSNPGFYSRIDPVLPGLATDSNGVGSASLPLADGSGLGVLLPDFLEAYAGRTTTYGFNGSVTRLLSERDSLSLTAGTRWSNSDAFGAADYRTETFSLAYDRSLSERVSLAANVNAGVADYSGRGRTARRQPEQIYHSNGRAGV